MEALFVRQNLIWLGPLIIIDLILKGHALWKSGRGNQPYWFVALLIVNSLGILPAIYLLFFQKKPHQNKD